MLTSMRQRLPVLAGAAVLAGLSVLVIATQPASGGASEVSRAEKLLKSKVYEERMQGLRLLESEGKGKKVEKAALRALDDDDWGVQIRACEVLAQVGDKDSVDELAKLATEGEIQWVRDAAVDALRALSPDKTAERLLAHARQTRDDAFKARALQAVGALGATGEIGQISKFLKNKDIRVSAAASRAIGLLAGTDAGRSAALEALEPVLRNRDDKKHFLAYSAAIESLGSTGDPAAIGVLIAELLQQPNDDPYIPERIARGLEAAGKEESAAKLADAWGTARKPLQKRLLARVSGRARIGGVRDLLEKMMLEDDEERVRSEAARALVRIGDPDSLTAFDKALGDKSVYVRMEAVAGLARTMPRDAFLVLYDRIKKDKKAAVRLQYVVELNDLGDPAGIAALETLLDDKAWRVASAAAAAIGTLGVADDLDRLMPLASHRDWRRRAAALEGMGRLRAANAVPRLIEGLRDKDPVVKGVCLTNLQILTQIKYGPEARKWEEWWTKSGADLVIEKQSRKTDDQKVARQESNKGYAREEAIEILQKARILVITGAWDKVQIVLGHLDIPHTLMRAQQLKSSGLNPNQILLVNCEGNLDGDTQGRVQWFVNVGGYLMTTDWALTKTVMPCFPGYVTQYSASSTGNDVVVVEEARPGHALTAGVFDNVPAMKWWLEIQAFPITIDYPERTEVLADSAEMKQRYGSSPMGIVFREGLGKVQHSLSHFYLQEEGMVHARKPRDRMIFAADNLGLSLTQIRRMAKEGSFKGALNEETMKKIAPDYSMFRLIVNMVREKSEWVENL